MESIYAKLAKLSYQTPDDNNTCNQIFDEFIQVIGVQKIFFNHTALDAEIYTIISDDKIIFICRGTESKNDIITDLNFFKTSFQDIIYSSEYKKCYGNIRIHKGFCKQFNSIKYPILSTIYGNTWKHNNNNKKIVFIGHSLGGALATLCAANVKAQFGDKLFVECWTFGSPRVGNKAFVKFFDNNIDLSKRFVNGSDIVTQIPKLGYNHVKGEIKIGEIKKCFFMKKQVKDHFIDSYINLFEK